jgi:hypothetical protein
MQEMKNAYEIFIGNQKELNHLKHTGVDGRIILKLILDA